MGVFNFGLVRNCMVEDVRQHRFGGTFGSSSAISDCDTSRYLGFIPRMAWTTRRRRNAQFQNAFQVEANGSIESMLTSSLNPNHEYKFVSYNNSIISIIKISSLCALQYQVRLPNQLQIELYAQGSSARRHEINYSASLDI